MNLKTMSNAELLKYAFAGASQEYDQHLLRVALGTSKGDDLIIRARLSSQCRELAELLSKAGDADETENTKHSKCSLRAELMGDDISLSLYTTGCTGEELMEVFENVAKAFVNRLCTAGIPKATDAGVYLTKAVAKAALREAKEEATWGNS